MPNSFWFKKSTLRIAKSRRQRANLTRLTGHDKLNQCSVLSNLILIVDALETQHLALSRKSIQAYSRFDA